MMLTQLTETVYALKVPKDIQSYGVYPLRNGTTKLCYETGFPDNPKLIDIPFDFAIICLASQATEEQAKEIVESIHTIDGMLLYLLYDKPEYTDRYTMFVIKSLQSLLTSKGCIDGEWLLIRKLK